MCHGAVIPRIVSNSFVSCTPPSLGALYQPDTSNSTRRRAGPRAGGLTNQLKSLYPRRSRKDQQKLASASVGPLAPPSPLTPYWRAGNVTLWPLPPRRSQMANPISFKPSSSPSTKCSSASASLPGGFPTLTLQTTETRTDGLCNATDECRHGSIRRSDFCGVQIRDDVVQPTAHGFRVADGVNGMTSPLRQCAGCRPGGVTGAQ